MKSDEKKQNGEVKGNKIKQLKGKISRKKNWKRRRNRLEE